MPKLLSFSNTAWYLHNYRVPVDRLLRARGWEIVMASPDGKFRDQIRAAGFRWHEVPMSRSGVNPLEDLQTAKCLAELIRSERPDVLHAFTMKGNINGSLAARLAGLPAIVNSIAGLGFVFSSDRALARVLRGPARVAYRAALARGQVIFQNGEDLEAFAAQGMASRDQSTLIRSSGVDVGAFRPTPEPAGRVRVLYAARLLWTKGIGELVEAARLLRARGVDFELLIAGDPDIGNPATVSSGDLDNWEAEGVIERLGFCSDMASLMQTCHVVCFPSKHKEGTPRFLIEAAACGLPIVTTRNRGCTEVVEHEVNGLLVGVGSVPELAAALERLIGNAELRSEYGQRGREIAVRDFSVMQVADRTEAVYRRLLA
ncbi:MAG: glycosyltransferase family 4 protein [Chthoniobacterales bacterium]